MKCKVLKIIGISLMAFSPLCILFGWLERGHMAFGGEWFMMFGMGALGGWLLYTALVNNSQYEEAAKLFERDGK